MSPSTAAYGGLMSLEWEQLIIDARDPVALGHWWADVLGWVVVNDSAEDFEIRPSAVTAVASAMTTPAPPTARAPRW